MASAQEQTQPSAANAGTEKGEQPAAPAEEEVWDEERIEQSLKITKEMHIQVHDCGTPILQSVFIDS